MLRRLLEAAAARITRRRRGPARRLRAWAGANDPAGRRFRRVAARGGASRLRIIVLTGPIAVAAIDNVLKPSAISAIASSGLPAISPHMLSGTPASRVWAMTSRKRASIGADSGSYRSASRGLPRSQANRNCTRSLVPIERKSIRAAQRRQLPQQRRHFEHDPDLDRLRQRSRLPSRRGRVPCRRWRGHGRARRPRQSSGNLTDNGRASAARISARSCWRSMAGRSSPMRIARQPIAGLSSAACGR